MFNVIFLKIGSSTFTWSPTSADGVNGTGTFLGLAQINGTADIRIYANLRDSIDPTQSPNFRFMDLRGDSFGTLEYVNSQNLVGTGDFV
ncbi:MAG: hypothetical protein LBF15_02530 [Candidatus Peribacteria bacterium]|nr:hypothetical protein [Candidatus Peribacteria bacterium]